MEITSIVIVALFVEAVMQAIKPIWNGDGEKLTVTEIISMAVGVAIAVAAKVNLLSGIVEVSGWLVYVMYVLTGIALGRGPSFVHDLWMKLKGVVTTQNN